MWDIFEYASFAPHGYCLLWNPWLIATHVTADLLIFLSYFAIPLALLQFLRRRPELRHRRLIGLFASFIMLCGLTHLVSLTTLWIPVYVGEGILKLATGIVSTTTAVTLFRLIPQLVAIPSPHDLAVSNDRLKAEIAAHEATLEQLRDAQRTLEDKVEERTRELASVTEKLSVLSLEAVHRSRNLLTVATSIARQTARNAPDLPTFMDRFLGRINALANATAALIEANTSTSVSMDRIVERQLRPVLLTFASRLTTNGPATELNAQSAQQISLVLHELATNSQKHGVLSRSEGTVDLRWTSEMIDGAMTFVLRWDETGGTQGQGTMGTGFGSALLLKIAPSILAGRAEATLTEGFHYSLMVPLDKMTPQESDADNGEELARKIVDEAWNGNPSYG